MSETVNNKQRQETTKQKHLLTRRHEDTEKTRIFGLNQKGLLFLTFFVPLCPRVRPFLNLKRRFNYYERINNN